MNKKILAVALMFALLISAIPIFSVSALVVPNADTFKEASIGNAETIDPAQAYDTACGEMLMNVYEGLVFFDHQYVDRYIPKIAESWPGSTNPGRAIIPSPPDPGRNLTLDSIDFSGDLVADPVVQTWYFKINPLIKWQEPRPGDSIYVETSDIEYSYERGMVNDPTTTVQWMFYNPLLKCMASADLGDLAVDANAKLMGYAIDNAIESNATHVWFNLRQSYAAFMQILSQTWAGVLDKEWVLDPLLDTGSQDNFPGFDVCGYVNWRDYNGYTEPGPLMDEGTLGNANIPQGRMMGSGPYKLVQWDADPATGSYTMDRFVDFHEGWSSHPHVDHYYMEMVTDWTTRKAAFLAGDYDVAGVPAPNRPEMDGSAGVRYLPGIATLAADGLFFNSAPNPAFPDYLPEMPIGTLKADLFSDRHTRLAFMYMMNKTLFAEEIYQGEANPIGNPIIDGIAYYDSSKPYYDYNVAAATYHFKMAWGGQDLDSDGDVEIPGTLWTVGFKALLAWNSGNTVRQAVCDILAYNIMNDIPWPNPALIDVQSIVIQWAGYMVHVRNNKLASYIVGWLADFPDPHNWCIPFMHTQGDFGRYQNVDYSTDPASLNWGTPRMFGPLPYTNWNGVTVTALSNDYVDTLIETGIGLPDFPTSGVGSRYALYQEVMDIFFAQGQTMMLVQALGRHYERDWLQGWYYNAIYPGYYVYDLWKEDLATVTRDLSAMFYLATSSSWTKYVTVTNLGETYEYFDVYEKVWVNDILVDDSRTSGWLAPGASYTFSKVIPGNGKLTFDIYVEISDWINCFDMTHIADWVPQNNLWQPISTKYGDLGSGVPPKFFLYDGKVDGKDLNLFLLCFKGKGPF